MASISVGDFPKVLSMALRELLEEQDLVHWNINSNKNVTSVVIRFAIPGQYSHTPVTWRKLPSQYRRDRQRFTNYATAQNNSHRGAHLTVIYTMKIWILLMKIVHRYVNILQTVSST